MQLTEEQRNFFNTFGYLHVPALFNPDEVAWITEEFDRSIQECSGGKEHDGSKRTMFLGPIEHSPKLCTLLDDDRVKGIIGDILGADFNYACGDGNYYSGDTGWHPDGNWGQLFACKVAFYLDSLTADTGCLRVIPGSHRPDHFIRAHNINPRESKERFGVEPRDFPGSIALETEPGDFVIFNHDLYHASFGGGTRRRMFTMNNTRYGTSEADLKLVYEYVSHHTPGAYKQNSGAGMYRPAMLDTADEARMIHLSQCVAIHDELFPDYARRA